MGSYQNQTKDEQSLNDRGLEFARSLKKLVAAPRLKLDDPRRRLAASEIDDIIVQLAPRPSDAPTFSDVTLRTSLPTKWIRARWECFKPDEDFECFPYFGETASGSASIDYIWTQVDGPNAKSRSAIATDVEKLDWITSSSILLSLGRHEAPDWNNMFEAWLKHNRKFDYVLFCPRRDPLVQFSSVFLARHDLLFERFKSVLPQVGRSEWSPIIGQIQQNIASREKSEHEPHMLREYLRMKAWFDLEQSETEKTVLVVPACPGLTATDLHVAAQTQRLAVVLLWLLYGKKIGRVSHRSIDYRKVEDQLARLKLRHRPAEDLDRKIEKVDARFSGNAPIKQEAQRGWRVCAADSGGHVAFIPELKHRDLQFFRDWFAEARAENAIDLLQTQFLIGRIDGPTLRSFVALTGIRMSETPGDLPNLPVLIDYGAIGLIECGLATKRFDQQLGDDIGLDLTVVDDLLVAVGSKISIVDPLATVSWLASRNIEMVRAGDQAQDVARFGPSSPPMPICWFSNAQSAEDVVTAIVVEPSRDAGKPNARDEWSPRAGIAQFKCSESAAFLAFIAGSLGIIVLAIVGGNVGMALKLENDSVLLGILLFTPFFGGLIALPFLVLLAARKGASLARFRLERIPSADDAWQLSYERSIFGIKYYWKNRTLMPGSGIAVTPDDTRNEFIPQAYRLAVCHKFGIPYENEHGEVRSWSILAEYEDGVRRYTLAGEVPHVTLGIETVDEGDLTTPQMILLDDVKHVSTTRNGPSLLWRHLTEQTPMNQGAMCMLTFGLIIPVYVLAYFKRRCYVQFVVSDSAAPHAPEVVFKRAEIGKMDEFIAFLKKHTHLKVWEAE